MKGLNPLLFFGSLCNILWNC